MARLRDTERREIVQRLACFESPSEVVEYVSEAFLNDLDTIPLSHRAVQSSNYVTFDSDEKGATYVGDLQTELTVGQGEVIWDTSLGEDAPGNLSVGWAGYDVPTNTL